MKESSQCCNAPVTRRMILGGYANTCMKCCELCDIKQEKMKESEKITAEQVLKQKGFYFVMPRPYTNENVMEVMEEFSRLREIELIEEMAKELYKRNHPDNEIQFNKGISLCISILQTRITELKK
jgi:hypothetical protein